MKKVIVGCFLTDGCEGGIEVPVRVAKKEGRVVLEAEHSEYYGLPCSVCNQTVSVKELELKLVIAPHAR